MTTGISVPKPRQLFEGYSERLSSTPVNYYETGLAALDEIIVGLPESELILIAGKPSQGKTALAVQIAVTMAKRGETVGVFSLEMARGQLADRVICAETGVDSQKLRKRKAMPLTEREVKLLDDGAKQFADLPIFVDDRGGLSAEKVYTTALSWKKDFDVRAIFLDYVGLIEGMADNRQEAIGGAARVFKQIAKELKLPFVALAQLNRAMDARDSRVPRLSDLRDSGQLEQVADTVLMFSYPNSPEDDLDNLRECQIHVSKQRNGPTGAAHVMFDKRQTLFVPLNADLVSDAREHREHGEAAKPKAKWKGFEPETETEPS